MLFLATSRAASLLLADPSYSSDLPRDMGRATSLSRIFMNNILCLYATRTNIISSDLHSKPKQEAEGYPPPFTNEEAGEVVRSRSQ